MDNLKIFLVLSYCCTLCYSQPALIFTPRKSDQLGASLTFNSQNGLDGAYDYGYREGHETGESFRRESGDAFGNKVGSYGLSDADGRVRVVRYIADENGFRADITSNEPGVAPSDPASATINKPQIVPAPVVPVAPVVAAYPPPPPVAYTNAKPLPPPQYYNSYNDPPPSYYPPPPAAKAYGPPPPPAQFAAAPKGGYYGPLPPAPPVAVAPKVGFYAPPPPPPPVAPRVGFYAPPVVAPVAVAPKFGFYAPPPPPPVVAPVAVAPKVGFYAPPPVAVAPVVKAAPVGFAALPPPPAAYLGNVVQTKGYVGAIRTLPSFVPPFAAFGYLNAKPSFQALGYPL